MITKTERTEHASEFIKESILNLENKPGNDTNHGSNKKQKITWTGSIAASGITDDLTSPETDSISGGFFDKLFGYKFYSILKD